MTIIRGVILDVDGTLVDSNDAHAQAWTIALTEHGHHVPYQRVRGLIGMGGDNLLPEVTGIEKDTPEGKNISERRAETFSKQFLPQVQAFPQVRALLQQMRNAGLRLVVASSAQAHELDHLLEIAHVTDLIEAQTSSDDAANSKPDPDIVQAALARLGLPADQVLMLGDTPYDITAAQKAGVSTVALRCGGFSDEDLAGAEGIYDSPADLLAHYDQSPFAG